MDEWDAFYAVCAKLGIKLTPFSPHDVDYVWSGKALSVEGMSASDAIHEVAHWLVAAKRRHPLPDYGIGPAVETMLAQGAIDARLRAGLSARHRDDEEARASLLGIFIEAALGLDWENTAAEHNWAAWRNLAADATPRRFWRIVAWLNERGLLRNHWPTCLDGVVPERAA